MVCETSIRTDRENSDTITGGGGPKTVQHSKTVRSKTVNQNACSSAGTKKIAGVGDLRQGSARSLMIRKPQ